MGVNYGTLLLKRISVQILETIQHRAARWVCGGTHTEVSGIPLFFHGPNLLTSA